MISYQTATLLEQVADEIKEKIYLTASQRAVVLDVMVEALGDTLTEIDISDSYSAQEAYDDGSDY